MLLPPTVVGQVSSGRGNMGDNDRHKDSVTIHTHSQDSRDPTPHQMLSSNICVGERIIKSVHEGEGCQNILCSLNRKQKNTDRSLQQRFIEHLVLNLEMLKST